MWVPRGLDTRQPCARVPRIRPSLRIIQPLWGTIRNVISPSGTSIHRLVFDHPLFQYRHLWQVCLNGSIHGNFYPLQYVLKILLLLFFPSHAIRL